ncbi:MAG: 4'-phosphopantetheinyl transferase superfamily protein [Ferruginibacter sp.]
MPLVYQQNINDETKIGVWHITETEDFFLAQVPLQREISHPHKRLQHLAGRYLLKELYPDFPYELIKIADTRKPFLESEVYHFSISHCGDYAAVIVSKKFRTGIDIELVKKKIEKIKHKFLNADEEMLLQKIADSDTPVSNAQLLIAAWSFKEAVYKWYGNGELDFKRHIHIENISFNKKEGKAYCRFLKNVNVELLVHFIFFEDNCISWVLTEN